MIGLEDRLAMAPWINAAHAQGASLRSACALVGIDVRTWQRWQRGRGADGELKADRRTQTARPIPAHALSESERRTLLQIANEPRFANAPPARIVPILADEGRYVASESSFRRVLKQAGQHAHRGRAKAPRAHRPPTTHIATGKDQVWCWDMTYLPTKVLGQWHYLYLIMDLYSRKILSWEVHESDDADHAVDLVKRCALSEGIAAQANKPVLHGDNGSTLKATSVLAMLQWLGVKPSYSRPRVSDDNAFVESLFRTAKYRPEFPVEGFESLAKSRRWAEQLVRWYNEEHRHSGIKYVTPTERHSGQDQTILARRHALYQRAKQLHPHRWSGPTRNWSYIETVTLNPESKSVISAVQKPNQRQSLAA